MNLRLFLFALGLGVVAAIPIGACQIEMAKRAIAGHLRASLMVALGSGCSDVLYGSVALLGIAPFLEVPGVLAAFSAIGALLLWLLAFRTLRESKKPHELDLKESLSSRRWALATGFFLGMSNPPIILSWLLGVAVAKRLGLSPVVSYASKAYFVAGASLGLAGYLTVMAIVAYRMRHFLSMRAVARVYWWLAIMLFALSLYFVHGVLVYFMPAP